MRIIVFTKPLPADVTTFFPEFNPETGHLLYTNRKNFMINPYDEFAMEEALRIKEKLQETEVTVMALGPPESLKSFEACAAMGADRGIFLEDNTYYFDSFRVASILAKAIDYFRLNYDLILCGKKAIDDNKGQVGTYLAGILNILVVRDVVKVESDSAKEKEFILNRRLARGDRKIVRCTLPALFTIDMGINAPRYPTFPSRLATKKKIFRISASTFYSGNDSQVLKVINLSEPKLRAWRLGPDPSLSPEERIKWMLTGGVNEKKGEKVSGNPENCTSKIIEFLIQNKIVSLRKR